jgi:hypothetical protein
METNITIQMTGQHMEKMFHTNHANISIKHFEALNISEEEYDSESTYDYSVMIRHADSDAKELFIKAYAMLKLVDETPETVSDAYSAMYEVSKKKETVNSLIREEQNNLMEEHYLPLLKAAEEMKEKIKREIGKKYGKELKNIETEEGKAKAQLADLKIKAAQNDWYAVGTKVTLHKHDYGGKLKKAIPTKTGVVQVFDGTQKLRDNLSSWNFPNHGDLLVIHHKQDGTLSLNFDRITNDYQKSFWLSDEDAKK